MWRNDIAIAVAIAIGVTMAGWIFFGGGYLYLRESREIRDAEVSAGS